MTKHPAGIRADVVAYVPQKRWMMRYSAGIHAGGVAFVPL